MMLHWPRRFFCIMNIESLLPFLFFIGLFLVAFLIEALVLYFFNLRLFWKAAGLSILINLLSLAVIYFIASALLSLLGYDVRSFNGLNPPVQVTAFLWWLSVIADGLLLMLFLRRQDKSKIFLASIIMNWLSFLFLYFFIVNSH